MGFTPSISRYRDRYWYFALQPALLHAQDDGQIFEEITVTGSRIARTSNLDTTAPIQVITSEDILNLGRYSVADALRSSTANSFGSFVPSSGSSAQSQATVDLLGVGPERTLVLLDGRRLPGSPSYGGTAVNVNQIPMAMVESIEILKGGASAIYGSDAIAGVVNIRLKRDFDGFEVAFNQQEPADTGGEAHDFSVVTGSSGERSRFLFAYEHHQQKPIFERDRPYTAASLIDTDGDGAFDTNIGVSAYGAAILNPVTEFWEPSPLCEELTATVPGFVGVIEPTPVSENRYCGYAYADIAANQASTNRDSIFFNSEYDLNDQAVIFLRALFTHNRSFGRFAPAADVWPGGGVPANSPHNPYDEVVSGLFRWYQVGNRDNTVDDYTQDYIAGIRGTLMDNLDYEVYFHHNTTDNKAVGEYYLSGAGVAYNLANDIDFGSEEGVENLRTTTLTQDFTRFDQVYAGAGFEAGATLAGRIGHYLGAEGFDIRYRSTVDGQSAAGLVGGSAGNNSGLDREIWAVFYEALVPLPQNMELEFAVRYDDYSDFGDSTSPKIALTWRPFDEFMLRGSWGQGFRAPSLEQLSQADSFAADFAKDYVACDSLGVSLAECPEAQFRTFRRANPDLDAETSTFINIGGVYETSRVTLALDLFDLEIEDAIRFVPIQDLILSELVGAPNPDPQRLTIDRVTSGFEQPEFTTSTINGPGLNIQGINLSGLYMLEQRFGTLDFNLETTYFLKWEEDNYAGGPIQDKAGFELQPEYRAQFTTTWRFTNHTLAWNMDYIPSTSGFETPDPNDPASGILITNERNDDFLIHNITYSFDGGPWGQYRFGVRNLTDEDPVLNAQGEYANVYDQLYSAGHIGRLYSVGATWQF